MKEREEATPPDGKATPANEETASSDEEDDKYGKYVEFLLDLLSFF